jgi:hypothetical protein
MSNAKLEDRAIKLMRQAAKDRLPVDAGLCGKLGQTVRDAYAAGSADVLRVVLDAWHLYVNDDDLDGFRDTLTELMTAYLPPDEQGKWLARYDVPS